MFSNPKSYEITKITKDNLSGFKIHNLDFKEQCKKTINKINEFLEKNKDEKKFTKKDKRKLEEQLEKMKHGQKIKIWMNYFHQKYLYL